MSRQPEHLPDKRQLRAAFEAAASRYDAAAVLQQEVAARLLERLQYIRLQPKCILDVGTGTGQCLAGLARYYPQARQLALDLAPGMLRQARRKQSWWKRFSRQTAFIAGDAEQLPLKDNSVDLIFSSLTLQWCTDLSATFAEFYRVLRPGGLLMFASLGPDTLKELRQCWSEVDGYSHVNSFIDLHDVGDMLLHTGFAEPVMDMEMLTMTYGDARTIMAELKIIGAHNVTQGRARGLTGKGRLQKVITAYEKFRHNEVLPVTYEVVYGHAWMAESKRYGNRVEVGFDATGVNRLAKP